MDNKLSELKLFMLRHTTTGKAVRDHDGGVMFFRGKLQAKFVRQEGQIVKPGPDHHRYIKRVGDNL